MPRFVVRLSSDTLYERIVESSDPGSEDLEALVSASALVLQPNDWIVEPDPISVEHIDAGFRLSCNVKGFRPTVVYADNAASATALAIKDFEDDQDGHYTETSKRWRADYRRQCTVLSVRKDAPRSINHTFSVDLAELLAPNVRDALSVDQLFELFRWITISSSNYRDPHGSQPISVKSLLNGRHGVGDSHIEPIRSIEDLEERIRYAILGINSAADQWRRDHQLGPTAKFTINVPHYGRHYPVSQAVVPKNSSLTGIFATYAEHCWGMPLSTSPNPYHDNLVAHWLRVSVGMSGFTFILAYGDAGEHPSRWTIDLASSRGNEPFYETLDRTVKRFQQLVPDFDQRLADQRAIRRAA